MQEKSKGHVLAPDVAEAQSQAVQTSLNRYGWADALAQHYQGLTFWALRGVLLLAFAAACCLQLSSRLGFANPLFLVCHLAFLSAAYAWYFWARRGGYQLKYIDYRALAEGLRSISSGAWPACATPPLTITSGSSATTWTGSGRPCGPGAFPIAAASLRLTR